MRILSFPCPRDDIAKHSDTQSLHPERDSYLRCSLLPPGTRRTFYKVFQHSPEYLLWVQPSLPTSPLTCRRDPRQWTLLRSRHPQLLTRQEQREILLWTRHQRFHTFLRCTAKLYERPTAYLLRTSLEHARRSTYNAT